MTLGTLTLMFGDDVGPRAGAPSDHAATSAMVTMVHHDPYIDAPCTLKKLPATDTNQSYCTMPGSAKDVEDSSN
jgi:hypothetical protein